MNVHLNHVTTEVLVKMESTVINVHVCLDLMERTVKTVSILSFLVIGDKLICYSFFEQGLLD